MNTKLFQTTPGGILLPANTTNEAGGAAYARTDEEALAQFAVTGCFNGTFYVEADQQLASALALAAKCSPEFVAKVAIYSRRQGLMKDMPAFLLATLAQRDSRLCARVFPLIIDNAKMLRNFVQAVRSGVTGRKSFGSSIKRLIRNWLSSKSEAQLFHASIGNKPSLADIIKMVHPKPATAERREFYAYLLGKQWKPDLMPPIVQQFEAFKSGNGDVPDCSFQFLSSLDLKPEQWKQIARNATWQTLRMNLNTFARHGCMEDAALVRTICQRLVDPDEIRKAKAMPYQLMAAYLNVDAALPPGIKMSLAQTMEIACANVPSIDGQVVVGVDVSGSMGSALTGYRKGATSSMRCVDVAALIACALVRKNPTAEVIPFDTSAYIGAGFAAGSIVDSAQRLSKFGGGGTSCELPLMYLNQQNKPVDLMVYVSDNESWFNASGYTGRATGMAHQWRLLQKRCPNAKMVCIDLTPNKTAQVLNERNVANVGGFSDAVFDFIATFASNNQQWADRINVVPLP